jgi:DamX protein
VSEPVKAPVTQTAPKATATTTHRQQQLRSHGNSLQRAAGKTAGNVSSLKSAPSSNYTLQLSSSSNYDNLNGWAKKEI